MMDMAVMLLPQPDSPTTPNVSPGANWKLTPSTARNTPRSVKKCVCKLRTSSTGSGDAAPSDGSSAAPVSPVYSSRVIGFVTALFPQSRVQGVPQPFTHQIDAQHRHQNGQTGESRDPPR